MPPFHYYYMKLRIPLILNYYKKSLNLFIKIVVKFHTIPPINLFVDALVVVVYGGRDVIADEDVIYKALTNVSLLLKVWIIFRFLNAQGLCLEPAAAGNDVT